MIYSKFSKISVSTIKSIRFLNHSWRCDAVPNARSYAKIYSLQSKVAIAHTYLPIGWMHEKTSNYVWQPYIKYFNFVASISAEERIAVTISIEARCP
jgi:hypothetical protein